MSKGDWWDREERQMQTVRTIDAGALPLDEDGKTRRWKYFVAGEMRRNPTRSEAMLWSKLKGRAPGFHRQFVLYGYVADFYCPAARLLVEVDGPVHAEQRRRDRERDQRLGARGFETVRFSDLLVTDYLSAVVAKIDKAVAERMPTQAPRAKAPGKPQEHWVEEGRARSGRDLLRDENGWIEVRRKRRRR